MSDPVNDAHESYNAQGYHEVEGYKTIPADLSPTGEQEYGVQLAAGVGSPGDLCRITSHSTGKVTWKKLVGAVGDAGKFGQLWTTEWADDNEIPVEVEASPPRDAGAPVNPAPYTPPQQGPGHVAGESTVLARLDGAARALKATNADVAGLRETCADLSTEATLLQGEVDQKIAALASRVAALEKTVAALTPRRPGTAVAKPTAPVAVVVDSKPLDKPEVDDDLPF